MSVRIPVRLRHPHHRSRISCTVAAGTAMLLAAATGAAASPADAVYRHGVIYTADGQNRVAQSLAVRDGRIVFVGSDEAADALVDAHTRVVDLGGRAVLPGLVDGHMHPLDGGANLLKCSLDYAPLTVAQFQARIQACLDARAGQEPDQWLEVVNWFRYDMRPKGISVSRATLDALRTRRPILVEDSFGHSALANSRALALANYRANTPDPVGGRLEHDAAGELTGMLEDAAQEAMAALLPAATAADRLEAARPAATARRGGGGAARAPRRPPVWGGAAPPPGRCANRGSPPSSMRSPKPPTSRPSSPWNAPVD